MEVQLDLKKKNFKLKKISYVVVGDDGLVELPSFHAGQPCEISQDQTSLRKPQSHSAIQTPTASKGGEHLSFTEIILIKDRIL